MDKKYSIFIIDDDKFLLDMYLLKFKNIGLVASVSAHPENALQILRAGYKPDIILLDLVMPGMDGLQLLDTARKENLVLNATVVVLSNQGQVSDIERAKTMGCDGYIIKAATIPSEVVSQVIAIHESKKAPTVAR